MIWKTLILYANTFITSLLIVIIVQIGLTAFLFFTEASQRLEVLGRLFVSVSNDGGIVVELGFESSIILAVVLSLIVTSLITLKKIYHGTIASA